jgi:hypothetical protein
MPETTLAWWKFLNLVGIINVVVWLASRQLLEAGAARFTPHELATRKMLFWLAGVYAAGCAFRSFFPMIDVPRLCLHETPLSRIFVGRSVATVAELAFVAQWALLLREAGAVRAARAVLALIVAAEALSWLAVLTTNDAFHAAENALWTLTAGIGAVFLATRARFQRERAGGVIVLALACASAYVLFMIAYVVPMYLTRWSADLAAGREYLALSEGLSAVLATCTVERDWNAWWQDALWLTPYFTAAVGMSIALPHVPPLTAGASAPVRPAAGSPRAREA